MWAEGFEECGRDVVWSSGSFRSHLADRDVHFGQVEWDAGLIVGCMAL